MESSPVPVDGPLSDTCEKQIDTWQKTAGCFITAAGPEISVQTAGYGENTCAR
jgi:hypothetical protein